MSCLTTHYVAATEKVFKYNHVVYMARFENGVAAEAVRIDVDYTVDLEIETSAIDLGDEEDDDAGIVRTLLSPPSDDGVPSLSAVATALPGMAPTAMFDISFSTPSLGKTTQLVIVPRPGGDAWTKPLEYERHEFVLDDPGRPFGACILRTTKVAY